mgnify:FL=1
MRRFTVLIFVFAATFSSLYSQSADEKLADILNSGDLFMLEEQYPQLKDKLQYPMLNILTESLLSDASNKPQEAYEKINELLTKYQAEAGFASAQTMFLVKCRNLAAMGKYAQAADELQYFMGEVSQHMDSLYLEAYKDAYRMYNSHRDTPAEELIRPREDCVIKYEADIFDNGNSLMFVPVTIDGKQERFILDTGCTGGAFMSERFAEEHNVRIVYDSLPIQGVGKGFGKLGVVDSIKIGNMIFKNLTVTIALPNAAIDTVYQVDAVLGQDLMKAAG